MLRFKNIVMQELQLLIHNNLILQNLYSHNLY